MATLLERKFGVKNVGRSVTVPDNDVARVMYYLRSVTLSCGLDIIMDDLVDFENYRQLSQSRADQVFVVGYQYSPDELHKKTIFPDGKGLIPAGKNNMFLEITQATSFLHAQSEVIIAGKSTDVKKIMLFKQSWLDTFYLNPMKRNVSRIERALLTSGSQHCEHCAGRPGKCACSSCPRKSGSQCSPSLSLTSLLGALTDEIEAKKAKERAKLRHCSHCKGLEAKCGCTSGCAKPAGSKCYGGHCSHCKGLDADCGCTKGCPRPKSAKCHQSKHCSHCKGLEAGCGCEHGCARPATAECYDKGSEHCSHCKGLGAKCGCKEGCDKPAASKCYVEHTNVMCDGCKEQDISGPRYKCVECPDYDLCEICYDKNKHDVTHKFKRIDRVGCLPVFLDPRNPRAAFRPPSVAPRSQEPSAPPGGGDDAFFYLSMSPGELKRYLKDNGVAHDDCFELDDLRRRVWDCHCDDMGGKELVQFMAANGIDSSGCRDVASRRTRAKEAYRAAPRPLPPTSPIRGDVGAAQFFESKRIRLHGLKSAQMNGKVGTIVQMEVVSGRAKIRLDSEGKCFNVKYENLESEGEDLD